MSERYLSYMNKIWNLRGFDEKTWSYADNTSTDSYEYLSSNMFGFSKRLKHQKYIRQAFLFWDFFKAAGYLSDLDTSIKVILAFNLVSRKLRRCGQQGSDRRPLRPLAAQSVHVDLILIWCIGNPEVERDRGLASIESGQQEAEAGQQYLRWL